jgi:hypothetical protein
VQIVPWWSDPVTGHSSAPLSTTLFGEY